ncbi:MAG TPA: SAM-dependent methyltransferase [Verrucomicrobiae bacterium]|nr:SAM-dependent methyltransferase [Verrucomicrobiae bacterium]
MTIPMEAIGLVETMRVDPKDDFWGCEQARITLAAQFSPEALEGITEFSHIEVLFLFHKAELTNVVTGARHPRNNPAWPKVGIFSQRGKNRPNRIGSTICRLMKVEGLTLYVSELDAIDETPVLDIKPVMAEFLPRGQIRQPAWSHELMGQYWLSKS